MRNVDPRVWAAIALLFGAAFVFRRVRVRWTRIKRWRQRYGLADVARGSGRAVRSLRNRR